MRASIKFSMISCLGLWLCSAGPAWAGGGGESLTSLQAVIGTPDGASGFCHMLGMGTNFGTTCPQLPTFTQAILEAAGLANSPPEMVAAQNGLPPGSNVYASNPAVDPVSLGVLTFPLNASTSPTLSTVLSTLTPLAFISSPTKPTPVQPYDPNANTFLYAVTVSSMGFATPPGGTFPDTLYLFYEDLSRTNQAFTNGQVVAKFSLPLTVLNSAGAERPVMLAGPPVKTTTLTITSCGNGCFMVTAAGDFLGNGTQQTLAPASCSATPAVVGISCAVVFSASATSSSRHAIFELAVPLVVTGANPPPFNTDPAYFYAAQTGMPGQLNLALYTAFLSDDLGFTPAAGILDKMGTSSIGIAPTAGPLCPIVNGASSCPSSFTFALCASLTQNGSGQQNGNAQSGSGQALVPSVAAYYGIATDGAALLSASLSSTSACPAF